MFELGSNLEHSWVTRLNAYGSLLSADVTGDDDFQTGFTDEEHWLTGACDAIVLPPKSHKAHVVEVKTTSHEKVCKMIEDGTVPKQHAKYIRQLKTYIGLAHELPFSPVVSVCKVSGLRTTYGSCPARMLPTDRPHASLHAGECEEEVITVIPPDDGTLIYSSREEPLKTASFVVRYSPEFMSAGRAKLAAWRDAFVAEEIPDHPLAHAKAKWSVDPCQWCALKKDICKPDYQQKITSLRDSNLIPWSAEQRPDYDYDEKRAAVLRRWHAEIEREEPITA
jgi:hypothetical protein